MSEKKKYVLDSFAVLAYLQDEPGAKIVEALLRDKTKEILFCTINLGEVYYIVHRERGLSEAEKTLLTIAQLPIREVLPDRNLILSAAELKAQFSISYADAFAIALTQRERATVVTGDPEFKKVQDLDLQWLAS